MTLFLFATHYLVMIITCAKLFSYPIMHEKVMNRTRTGFTEAYAQSLSANCDLDFWHSDMLFVRNTMSSHDNYLCQIILKSHHAWQSYESVTSRFTLTPIHKILVRTVTLTFDIALCFLFATHRLVMTIICAKLLLISTMHDDVVGWTRFRNNHKHTHTHRGKTLYALPPFHGGGIKVSS